MHGAEGRCEQSLPMRAVPATDRTLRALFEASSGFGSSFWGMHGWQNSGGTSAVMIAAL